MVQAAVEQAGQGTKLENVAEQGEVEVQWHGLVFLRMHCQPHWTL